MSFNAPEIAQAYAPQRSFAPSEPPEAIPDWAKENDDNLLRFLFVAPRPCEALDALIDNAIRYTPAGGSVLLRVQADADGVRLEVRDSGPGIAVAEREKVFTPFYRVAATMEVNPAGTGLGLAIVREIAVVHRAQLTLAPGDGGAGLSVSIVFPSVNEAA